MQRAAGIHPLIAFVAGGLAVWLVLTFLVRDGRASTAGRVQTGAGSLGLPAGPLDGSVVPAADAPTAPDGGPNAAALWVHGTALLPAAPVELLAAAGIPVEIVHDAAAAFRHPLVLSWPRTELSPAERAAFARYSARGGTLLAIAPDAATEQALVGRRGAVIARLASVPETGLANGGLRDLQIAALRRWWAATPGGFRLGDAPSGRAQAVVFVHDLRSRAALAAAPALARAEQELGVHATWPIETKYLADEAGGALVGDERSVIAAIRRDGGELASGRRLGRRPRAPAVGDGREAYPAYSPAQASPTQLVGATVLGEARVGRHLLAALGGGTSDVFRGVGRETNTGFAGALEAAGVTHRRDARRRPTPAARSRSCSRSPTAACAPCCASPSRSRRSPPSGSTTRVGAMMAIALAHRRERRPHPARVRAGRHGPDRRRAQRRAAARRRRLDRLARDARELVARARRDDRRRAPGPRGLGLGDPAHRASRRRARADARRARSTWRRRRRATAARSRCTGRAGSRCPTSRAPSRCRSHGRGMPLARAEG